MRFTSRSQQPSFAMHERQFQHLVQLTVSWWVVTKTDGLSNTLRVQKGQWQKKTVTMTLSPSLAFIEDSGMNIGTV